MRGVNLAADLAGQVERAHIEETRESYPLVRYQDDPVAYVRERLRVPHVMSHQAAILEALAAGVRGEKAPRVAVRSGQKVGKTAVAVWACLWFYECFAEARVWLCAAIEAQTKAVLWHELRQTLKRARDAGADIDGKFAQSPAGGFVSSDGTRAIHGISGRDIESIAGLSGRQLTVIDEASHLPAKKAAVFEGNTLGGGSLQLWISNPTRNEGPFYEAFHSQKQWWQTFHVDGERVARWQIEAGIRIPFTITWDKVEEAREREGEDSPFWLLRIKGEWLRNETGRAIPMALIESAEARWAVAEDEGPLVIGYDCAGPGNGGDEHCWAVVRGSKCIDILRARGLSEDEALERTYSIMSTHRRPAELPRIMVDAEGPIGSALYGRMRAERDHRRTHDPGNLFEVNGVKGSSRFVKNREMFERVRDELVWVLAEWVKTGAIPKDDKLVAELYAPVWQSLPSGQLKATPKPMLRDILGRSPDSFDALALAVWRPAVWMPTEGTKVTPAKPPATIHDANAWAWEDQAAGGEPWWPQGVTPLRWPDRRRLPPRAA